MSLYNIIPSVTKERTPANELLIAIEYIQHTLIRLNHTSAHLKKFSYTCGLPPGLDMVYNCVRLSEISFTIISLCGNEVSHIRLSGVAPPSQNSSVTEMFSMKKSTSRTLMLGKMYTGAPSSTKFVTKEGLTTKQYIINHDTFESHIQNCDSPTHSHTYLIVLDQWQVGH